ncbi:MAG: DUF4093 domain-containing protein [Oscillospiraceae bacterium]|nr:DUF4093 domain-containing protein [Oscillospiraceae bacterium]
MDRVEEIIVVEGRYDKNTLLQCVDATVIETEGFGVFNNREKLELIRTLSEARGVIILTDSDGAGFLIRSRLKGSLNGLRVKEAFVPDVSGKEKRKKAPSAEGKLGVEGMDKAVILESLRRAGATFSDGARQERAGITKADLFEMGLSGRKDAAEKRSRLCRELGIPERISASGFLDVVNVLLTPEELAAKAALL